jgi:CheY-like chemotaxis protein
MVASLGPGGAAVAGERVLVVEDESIVARDLAERLVRLGYAVPGVASSGAHAIALAELLEPDLVLMDVTLKGDMDGIAAAETIRARRPVPIVFVTAYADPATVERAKRVAPFGYILKPFDARELEIAVELALAKQASECAARQAAELRAVMLLAAAAAHEINNPLTVVKGELQLLERALRDTDDGRAARIAGAIEAADRIAAIVARLRRITRIESTGLSANVPDMLDIARSSDPE